MITKINEFKFIIKKYIIKKCKKCKIKKKNITETIF